MPSPIRTTTCDAIVVVTPRRLITPASVLTELSPAGQVCLVPPEFWFGAHLVFGSGGVFENLLDAEHIFL
jgi:hypothetical protein